VGIGACIATLRYDMALMLPKDDTDAACLLGVSEIAAVIVAGLAGVMCLAFGGPLGTLLRAPEIVPWLWSVPVSIFLAGTWQTLTSWATRRRQFHRASTSQVMRAVTAPGFQVAAGLYHPSVLGLVLGGMVGDVCASGTFASHVFRHDWPLIRASLQYSRMKQVARAYADFPMYTTPQSLLNTVSQCVPSLLLAHYFGVAVVGYYSFGVRIVQLPLNLVMASLRPVFFQRVAEVYNCGGDIYGLFKKSTLGLIGVVVLPTLAVVLFAPALAAFVLGSQWYTAGEYARWLTLWIAVGFCNVPAVLVGQIYRRQRTLLRFDVAFLVCRVLAIVIGGMFCTALHAVILFSVVGIVYNAALILWAWSFLRECGPARREGTSPLRSDRVGNDAKTGPSHKLRDRMVTLAVELFGPLLTRLCLRRFGSFWNLRDHLRKQKRPNALLVRIHDKHLERLGSWIPYTVDFGGEPCFPHGPTGVFVSQRAKIGKNAVIFHHVTIGSNTLNNSGNTGSPIIGDSVYIGAGAKIIGGIRIGDNCRIGANAVVYDDMPPHSVAVASPTRLIQKANLDNRYYSMTADGKWVYFNGGRWIEDETHH